MRTSSSEELKQRQLLLDMPAPFVTSTSWIIIDDSNGKNGGQLLFAKNEHEPRQVASLTKIMTANVVLKLLLKLKMSDSFKIRVLS